MPLPQSSPVSPLSWEHKQQSSTLDHARTPFARVLCCIQLKKKFFSLRSGFRLSSKYFSYTLGSKSQHQASVLYPAGVTMQLFQSVGIVACATRPEWLKGTEAHSRILELLQEHMVHKHSVAMKMFISTFHGEESKTELKDNIHCS